MQQPAPSGHRVAVIGGGFGGLYAAQRLGKDDRVDLTLVDRRNHHVFQPLLYQVATGALSPGEIAQPLRSILRRNPPPVILEMEPIRQLRMSAARGLDVFQNRCAQCHDGRMTGVTPNMVPNPK